MEVAGAGSVSDSGYDFFNSLHFHCLCPKILHFSSRALNSSLDLKGKIRRPNSKQHGFN